MATLAQQCFMRLHNTSETASETIKLALLNEFMHDLWKSGYSESDRFNILTGAINTYKKLKNLEHRSIRPFYRPNSFMKSERKENKLRKKKTWYKGKNCDSKFMSVMFVEATPGDTLLKMIRETEEKHKISENMRIKIVSKSGTKLSNLLEKRNPFAENCKSYDCPPCASINQNSSELSHCMVNNTCCEVTCKTCEKSR